MLGLGLGAAVLVAACGREKPEISPPPADASIDAGVVDSSIDSSRDAGSDGDGRKAIFQPADPKLTRLLVPEPATLVGYGTTSCTNAIPSSGDVWCAFSRPSTESGGTELWVFNFTQASATAAAVPLACDGTSSACRLLATDLWTKFSFDGPSHPSSHRFDGDTLIFYAGGRATTDDLYQGPVWAWRPGWPEARPLTSPRGFSCSADRRTPTVTCLDDVTTQMSSVLFGRIDLRSFDLRAGRLDDAHPLEAPLPLVEHIAAQGSGDLYWQAGFSPSGDWFLYSSATSGGGPSAIRLVATAGLGTAAPAVIAADGFDWRVSHDETLLYHRQGVDLGAGYAAVGRLATVPFPQGGEPRAVTDAVNHYELLGAHDDVFSEVDRGVVLWRDTGEDYPIPLLLADPARPDQVVLFPRGAQGIEVSLDLAHSLFYLDGTGIYPPVRVMKNDGSGICGLTRYHDAESYAAHFSHTSKLVFWIEFRGDSEEGWYATPATCADARKFGDYVTQFVPVGDDLVVFRGTDFDDSAYHLQYARLGGDASAPRILPWRIDRDVDSSVVVLTHESAVNVLYGLSRGDAVRRGIFVHGPLPR